MTCSLRLLQVRGGAKVLAASTLWSFQSLADRAAAGGTEASAQVGTIEQGPTRSRQATSAADYLRGLARDEAACGGAGALETAGLLPPASPEGLALARGEAVPLRWEWLRTLRGADRLYLSQWCANRDAPEPRRPTSGSGLFFLSLCWPHADSHVRNSSSTFSAHHKMRASHRFLSPLITF